MTNIRTVGVIGAGQMGNGIAHVCALAGYDVLLNDADKARIEAALGTISKNLTRQVHREVITQAEADAALKRIKGAAEYRHGAIDLIIESIVEQDEASAVSAGFPAGAETRGDPPPTPLDLDHAPRRHHRSPGQIHRHSFYESGALMKLVELIRGLATSQKPMTPA